MTRGVPFSCPSPPRSNTNMPTLLNFVTSRLSTLLGNSAPDTESRKRTGAPPSLTPQGAGASNPSAAVAEAPRRESAKRRPGPTLEAAPSVTAKPRPHRRRMPPRRSRHNVNGAAQHRGEQRDAPAEIWSGTGRFGEIPVSPEIDRALVEMGYRVPTPIQERVISLVREDRDLVGQAQTGTGKTAAFGIPIVEAVDTQSRRLQALVLTPTRELALQVSDEISKIGLYRGVRAVSIYGGQPMKPQIDALQRGGHVVVATPGRLMDHMQRRTLSLRNVRTAVLDEADQMLDIGFIDDIEYILRQTPRSRQTLLFSATIPYPIRKLTRRYLKDPEWIRVGGDAEPVDEVRQVYYEVAAQDRGVAIREVLDEPEVVTQALIFRRTRAGVNRLVDDLRRNRYDAQGIHSDMTQAQRERVMANFRAKNLRLLVATNVASRGLDIPAVSHVINYDMPDNLEEYVHRIGRTARAGRRGTAITFVSDLQDFQLLDALQEHLGHGLKQANLAHLYS